MNKGWVTNMPAVAASFAVKAVETTYCSNNSHILHELQHHLPLRQ
ncbi:hypothetical protein C942_03241 [Photobacterium marinum]|uniref:Uncharacterized protein n=1 Tax=Photobacterium marinum TaxID=1056511 RepID=L8J559_9GAMM|nr:hypothetical protein C942_03241 [Photobacterium marinum]